MELAKEFYTVKELAALLGVSTRTIDRLLEQGALPHYRVGRSKRFHRTDIEAYLQRVRRSTLSATASNQTKSKPSTSRRRGVSS